MSMPTAMSTDCSKPHSKYLLVVIDMQKDFVTGSLGTKEAVSIVESVVRKVQNHSGLLAYTLDTHDENYLQSREGMLLPVVHCIKGESGHELVDELKQPLQGALVFEKPTFASVALASWIASQQDLEEVELVGVCTDICVVSNALMIKAMRPELVIRVDAACCAGSTVRRHEAALETLRSCQIEVF